MIIAGIIPGAEIQSARLWLAIRSKESCMAGLVTTKM